jgi:4-amino-4-deoxychorismate lyase
VIQAKKLHEYLHPPAKGLYRCRVVYNTKSIHVEYYPYVKRVVKQLKLIYDDTIVYDKKYEDRSKLGELFLQKGEADDILIIKNAMVSDTSIANVAFFDGKRWLTPHKPLLHGTTRARLLERGIVHEAEIYERDIVNYKRVALLNAMIDFDIIATDEIRNIYC